MPPPSWRYPICQLGLNSIDPDVGIGFENIDFMVWMKVAALPKFRKLYRILNRQVDMFSNGLPKGQYQLTINYSMFMLMLNLCIYAKNLLQKFTIIPPKPA